MRLGDKNRFVLLLLLLAVAVGCQSNNANKNGANDYSKEELQGTTGFASAATGELYTPENHLAYESLVASVTSEVSSDANLSEPHSEDQGKKSEYPLAPQDEINAFAASIEKLTFETKNIQLRQMAFVTIKFVKNKYPVVFKGQLSDIKVPGADEGARWVGTIATSTPGMDKIFIEVDCNNKRCAEAKLIFKDNANLKIIGAAVKSSRDVVGKVKEVNRIAENKTKDAVAATKTNKAVATKVVTPLPKVDLKESLLDVNVKSTQELNFVVESLTIMQGRSFFTMKEESLDPKKPTQTIPIIVEGELTTTNGLCLPLKTPYANTVACLIGNDKDGRFVIRYDRKGASVLTWIEVGSSRHNIDKTMISDRPCHITEQKDADPLVKSILEDCTNPAVRRTINDFWMLDSGKSVGGFLKMFGETKLPKAKQSAKTREFADMLKIVRANQFHPLLSIITLIESNFDPHKTSSVGAKGFWQLMPDTAKHYGASVAPVDQRTQIVPATKAAVKYFKHLFTDFDPWAGNYKLAVAAYNVGEGGLTRRTDKLEALQETATVNSSAATGEKVDLTEIATFSADYWELYKRNMLPKETKNYVLRFISAALMALDPDYFDVKAEKVEQK